MNNLLSVIMGIAETLADDMDPTSDQHELVLTSLRAAEHGAELLRRLVAGARPQAISLEPVDCRQIVEAIRPMARQLIRDDTWLEIQTPGHPLFCLADATGLEAALLNLLINGRDAMQTGGCLSLRAQPITLRERGARRLSLRPGAYVVFKVRDTGVGMTRDTIKKALQPFFTTKGAKGGAGLGLNNALDFARQSAGRLAIASKVGRGTSVSIYLPRTAPARPRLEPVCDPPQSGHSHQGPEPDRDRLGPRLQAEGTA